MQHGQCIERWASRRVSAICPPCEWCSDRMQVTPVQAQSRMARMHRPPRRRQWEVRRCETRSGHFLQVSQFLQVKQARHSLLTMKRMEAMSRNACALRLRFSQSLLNRRQRFSQASVLSTTQRLGNTTKPLA